jgi:DNA-binding response OmpR family regulator
MENMSSLSGKRVVVLSDHRVLTTAIELSLKHMLQMEIVDRASDLPAERAQANDLDLLVLATSSPDSEPILVLARASLAGRVGQVPLLMISSQPFDTDLETKIFHLDFPFEHDELCTRVVEILGENAGTRTCGQLVASVTA